MHACFARNYPEALSHCGHGHDLTSVAQLSVINKADIKSALDKTLASERFRRNAVDNAAGFYASIYIYEHEAIQKPKSENNIGAPLAPQLIV